MAEIGNISYWRPFRLGKLITAMLTAYAYAGITRVGPY